MTRRMTMLGLTIALTAGLLTACRFPGDPVGNLESVTTGNGTITVAGWAYDESAPTTSIDVHIFVDGAIAGALNASGDRPDVAAAVPGAGAAHGYNATLNVGAGAHKVCTYAINIGDGKTNTELGCKTVAVTDGSPIGNIEFVGVTPLELIVRGWTIDPDTAASINVGLEVDGVVVLRTTADLDRSDVGSIYTDYGNAHGFVLEYITPLNPLATVCVNAYNAGGGVDKQLGCRRGGVGVERSATTSNPVRATGTLTASAAGAGSVVASGVASDSTDPTDPRAAYSISYQSFNDDFAVTAFQLTDAGTFAYSKTASPGFTGPSRVCLVVAEGDTMARTLACQNLLIT
ncbi:MAG: hypothetical protein U0Q22_16465 [Acidimicrobiales bacterium]